ncbi:MAG: DUF4190 domain-containing protein [Lactobacillaceae bacterium]|jgi:hypothetical protein|nr:DUF4190 domain-containing protein [Lactobacillaceae bacterium]
MNEKKALGIIAIIFGGIGLILSWIPVINNAAFFFGGIGVILGIIALIVNRKNKKVLAIVGTALSVLSIAIVLITQSMYEKAVNHVGDSVKSSLSKSDKKEADSFKWTKTDYDNLMVGDETTGMGGASYDDIVAKFGKPKTSDDSQNGDMAERNSSWTKTTSNGSYESVDLAFVKQADGSYLLSMKNSTSLK